MTALQNAHTGSVDAVLVRVEKIVIELMTSDRKIKAYREDSK